MNPEQEYFKIIVTECLGCGHKTVTDYCNRYIDPSRQWTRQGGCAMRTHNKPNVIIDGKKLNPIKASRRAAGGKK